MPRLLTPVTPSIAAASSAWTPPPVHWPRACSEELQRVNVQVMGEVQLEVLQAVLREAGLTLDNVVKTTVFVQDLGDFGTVNEIYGSYFHGGFPARSCVQIAALPKGALVEIECIAVR